MDAAYPNWAMNSAIISLAGAGTTGIVGERNKKVLAVVDMAQAGAHTPNVSTDRRMGEVLRLTG